MIAKLTDEEMIRQYLTTQPDHCYETLYKRYVSKVYQRCLSVTHDSTKAEDFTHDIFLKLFEKLNSFQERSRFSTWLYSISHNYCLDQVRTAKRLATVSLEDNVEYDMADSQDALWREETLQMVKRVMETLSEDETTLLRLRYEDGCSVSDIAHQYRINVSAVKMRLKRSRDKIYQLYEKQCDSDK